MAQVPLLGGPADGLTAASAPPGTLAFIEIVAVRRSRPNDRTSLYRSVVDPDGSLPRWVVAGAESRCEGCGATYRRAEGGAEDQGCPLCGAGARDAA